MSPELGLALFAALLLGLAAVWLIYRAIRGHRGRPSGSSNVASEPMRSSQPSPHELASLVGRDGFWVCQTCRSLNRRAANQCYSCHSAMGSAGQRAPAAPPVGRKVPVKAEGIARSSGKAAGTIAVLATTEKAIPAPAVPATTEQAITAPAVPATTGKAIPAPAVLVRHPEPETLGAPGKVVASVPVCPFLGFRDDPSTRCDFPDPRNLCHATSKGGATLSASPRRFVTGKAGAVRPQPIDAEHQKSRCLSVTHEQCARYPAVQVVAPNR